MHVKEEPLEDVPDSGDDAAAFQDAGEPMPDSLQKPMASDAASGAAGEAAAFAAAWPSEA